MRHHPKCQNLLFSKEFLLSVKSLRVIFYIDFALHTFIKLVHCHYHSPQLHEPPVGSTYATSITPALSPTWQWAETWLIVSSLLQALNKPCHYVSHPYNGGGVLPFKIQFHFLRNIMRQPKVEFRYIRGVLSEEEGTNMSSLFFSDQYNLDDGDNHHYQQIITWLTLIISWVTTVYWALC